MKKSDESPPPFDLDSLMRPQPYKVRVYVLEGKGLQPKDLNGKSDPYIKVRAVAVRTSSRRLCAYNPDGSHVALARAQLKLGKKTVSDHKNALDSTNDPEFYRCFEMATELPGTSRSSEPRWRVGWRTHEVALTCKCAHLTQARRNCPLRRGIATRYPRTISSARPSSTWRTGGSIRGGRRWAACSRRPPTPPRALWSTVASTSPCAPRPRARCRCGSTSWTRQQPRSTSRCGNGQRWCGRAGERVRCVATPWQTHITQHLPSLRWLIAA